MNSVYCQREANCSLLPMTIEWPVAFLHRMGWMLASCLLMGATAAWAADATVTVTATDAAASETGPDTGTFTFTRTGETTTALTVNFTRTGTATSGSDFIALPTTVTIPVGYPSATVTVTPVNDTTAELDETVVLTLAAGTGYTVGAPSAATVTIADNETPYITISATDNKAMEPGTDTGTFTFTRKGNKTAALTVNFTRSGTATSGTDFTAIGTTVPIAAGSSTGTITLTALDDTVAEVDETVILTIATGTGYTKGSPSAATVTIGDNEAPVIKVSATDNKAMEPGTDTGKFTFTRMGVKTAALTVNFTRSGTATSGTDFTAIPTTVSIAAGAATGTITVTALDDTLTETDETVKVTLTAGTGYAIGSPNNATVTIWDNEAPTVSVAASDNKAMEPGTNTGKFTFTRKGNKTSALTVNFEVSGTATSGTDYTAIGTTVSIGANSATATKTVTALDDATLEPDETVIVTLAAGMGYTAVSPTSATVTIWDNEAPVVSVTATDATASEPGTDTGAFTFTRLGNKSNALTVNFSVNGTATSGTDYTSIGTTVSIAANAATATKTVTPLNDSVVEPEETVAATLTTGTGYTPGTPGSATITINDDDPLLAPSSLAVAGTDTLRPTYTWTAQAGYLYDLSVSVKATGAEVRMDTGVTAPFVSPADLTSGTEYTWKVRPTLGSRQGAWVAGPDFTILTNRAPMAQDQTPSTNEDTALAITLTATDADNNPLTYQVLTQPAHGTLTGTAPNLTYTPALNYFGSDSFTFKANDGQVDSNVATVTITVVSVNDPPVAQAQAVQVDYNGQVAVTLVATDVENSPLTYSVVTNPAHGTLTGTAPNLTYKPTVGYSGADSFTFKANDGTVYGNTATVSVTVNPLPILSGTIAANRTLTGLYRVDGTVTVNSGVTLTLQPGTILKFSAGAAIDIYGTISAIGTAQTKIYFTSIKDDTVGGDTNGGGASLGANGDWWGISARPSSVIQLTYTEVRFGGSTPGSGCAAAIYGQTPTTLSLQNCVVSDSGTAGIVGSISSAGQTITVRNTEVMRCTGTLGTGKGISLSGWSTGVGSITVADNNVHNCTGVGIEVLEATPRTVTGNTIQNNTGLGLHVYPNTDVSTNTMTANGNANAVGITAGSVATNTTWQPPAGSTVFLLDGSVTVPAGKSLTVPTGTTVKMNSGLSVYVYGTLQAQGTAANKVYFTSYRDDSVGGDTNGGGASVGAKGDWCYLMCRDGSTVQLTYTEIRFAGGDTAAVFGCNTPAELSLKNCVVTKSLSAGIRLQGGFTTTMFVLQGTEISYCNQSGLDIPYGTGQIFAVSSGNTFSNNSRYGAEISQSGLSLFEASNFTSNTLGGAYAVAGATMDLRSSYWGHESGPNAGAGTGSGQSVSNTILYNPWRVALASTVPLVRSARFNSEKISSAGQLRMTGVADESANWDVSILDSGSNVIRTLSATGMSAGIVWDGRNASNQPVPDGRYTVNWTVTSQVTPSRVESLRGFVDVSAAKAIVRLDAPAENALVKVGSTVTVTGVVQAVAGGDAINSYDLEYGLGTAPTAFSRFSGYPKTYTTPVSGTLGSLTVPTGASHITFRLRALVNSTVSAESRVTVAFMTNGSVSLALFSPNGDGVYDTTTITGLVGTDAAWQLAILDGGGGTVRSETLSPGGLCRYTWDGRNDGGTVVPDGSYTLRLTATGGSTNSITGSTVVDNTPPVVLFTAPAENELVCPQLSVRGTVSDAHFGNWVLNVGQGAVPVTYSILSSGSSPMTNGNLATWDPFVLAPGTWTLYLRSTDGAGNTATCYLHVQVDRINLTNVTVPNEFAPAFGTAGSFSFDVDKPSEITATIHHVYWTVTPGYTAYNASVVESTPVRTMQTTVTAPGRVTMAWNGRTGPAPTDPLVQEGCYLVRLSATQADTVLVGKYDPPYSVDTTAENQRAENVTVSPIDFDPTSGRGVTYTYGLSRSAFVFLQVLQGGTAYIANVVLVQPRAVGTHTEVWDGRYGEGHALAGQFVAAGGAYQYNGMFLNARTPINSMIVNNAFKVSSLIAEQYRIHELYNHVSTLKFALSQQATVAVTVRDPNNNVFRTLRTHSDPALQLGPQELLWDGRDGNGRIVDTEGLYTVQVEAIEPTTGITTSAQTVIQVYK